MILAFLLAAFLAVDVFPDIPVPRVTLQTEAGGYTAEEVEELVTIPIETAMSGIQGLSTVRSSSGGGLSFVWLDFDWSTDLTRARFDVFERLSRVKESLPEGVETEIAPVVSVTGEIMLVALTSETNGVSALELREIAEYDLRQRLLGVPGIGEVAVIGGRLPEYRVAVDPHALATLGLTLGEVIEAAADTRTRRSAGYLANVSGEEIPLRQIARADTLEELKASALPREKGVMRLGDVADITLSGAPRRGSASFQGEEAVVLSVQKAPGGNTPELTRRLEAELAAFAETVKAKGIKVHTDAYRQADFIAASVQGGGEVLRDAVIVVVIVLLLTLLELRTLLVVLISMPISILLGLALFPALGLGVNVMTLGGFAVAAGDIVDAAIIFTDAIRRKLPLKLVAPGVLFSTLIVALVFLPLLLLGGLEGCFFRPLALSYLAVFAMSLVSAFVAVPLLCKLFRVGTGKAKSDKRGGLGERALLLVYRPALKLALKFPKSILLASLALFAGAVYLAKDFGSSFLPPFREDSFNVALSLPPGASLAESERVAEACVPLIREIPGVLSVTRRTGRAERDQHAEPVSSSEYVVRVDLKGDPDGVRAEIRRRLGAIPGCSLLVGYPIAHRISAVLSGTEAEIAINVFGENPDVLREVVRLMKSALTGFKGVSDVRANREIMVRTLKIDYDTDALREAGLTLREAGEQVSAAFYGLEVGEVRDGVRRRSVVVRLAGDENELTAENVKGLLLTSRLGRLVRLDEVAAVEPEDASNLLLREGGRRKALISLNAADGVSTGELVEDLKRLLTPIASAAGCTVTFTGSAQARESAAQRLALLGLALLVLVFAILALALKSPRAALLALLNIPLGLVGGVIAVKLADPVLSVSSLVGFITVAGFVIRNGLLLLSRYQDRLREGAELDTAIREGSEERMPPIIMTSLTTVFGLVPIMIAGAKPGGELLAPLAVVQFGGILGATCLNLIVLPAATKLVKIVPALLLAFFFAGCKSYEAKPIDWETLAGEASEVELKLESPEAAALAALVGNGELNRLRLKALTSDKLAAETGWWEDPELDYDFLRVLKAGEESPWITGFSLSFTIPLSGVPKLEEKAAQLYAEADRAEIVAAETEVAAKARIALVKLVSFKESAARLDRELNDEKLKKAFAQVEALVEAGELTRSDLAGARLRVHKCKHARGDLDGSIAETEAELRELLGVDPRTKLIVPEAEVHGVHSHHHAEGEDILELVKHPKVKAALARLEGDEAKLEAEIRRQYPDLKLGPSYSYEDGANRAGFTAGLTLPLWNRNRKGIAEAEGARDETRLSAIETWREVVRARAAACRQLDALEEHPEPPPTDRATAEALLEAGEIGPLDYLALAGEILEAELAEIEWRRETCLAVEELLKYSL